MTAPDLQHITSLILRERTADGWSWPWLSAGEALSRKDANKFLLGCILCYQIPTESAWANAGRLAVDLLGDPEDLWGEVTRMSLDEWVAKRELYKLHRYPKGHERVYTIGKRIAAMYAGDARTIWENQLIESTLWRLNDLGVGPQISRMTVGALVDTGRLSGRADVKVDSRVRRVLGRVIQGRPFAENQLNEVVDLTRTMHPANPWLLDRPLYLIGENICSASKPKCSECFLIEVCGYARRIGRDAL